MINDVGVIQNAVELEKKKSKTDSQVELALGTVLITSFVALVAAFVSESVTDKSIPRSDRKVVVVVDIQSPTIPLSLKAQMERDAADLASDLLSGKGFRIESKHSIAEQSLLPGGTLGQLFRQIENDPKRDDVRLLSIGLYAGPGSRPGLVSTKMVSIDGFIYGIHEARDRSLGPNRRFIWTYELPLREQTPIDASSSFAVDIRTTIDEYVKQYEQKTEATDYPPAEKIRL